jgi:large subunit ribosomal protein L18
MDKKNARIRRATRTRQSLKRQDSIRLVVHRTSRHIYAQLMTPDGSKVLTSASTLEKSISGRVGYTGNRSAAAVIGEVIAERATKAGITSVAFDRSGFKYHGRVQAVADSARKFGLQF